MDKVKINNQVVKMRKHVKRARLFAINKFTKQLKQLQIKKGIDSRLEKNQRKIERLLEKVKILKKMMPDYVSKKALSKAQDWNAVLAQKNVSLEDQCLALLANDTEVQKEVNKFHAEECQLIEKIPSFLLEWEMKKNMPSGQNKKASDIKRQKLDKIAKRKRSNFKGATFPNNMAVNKKPSDYNKKKRLPDIPHDKGGNLDDSNKSNNLKSESFNESESRELFSKTAKDSKGRKMELSEPIKEDELDSESTDDDEPQNFFTKAFESNNCLFSKEQTKENEIGAQMTEEKSTSNVDFSCVKQDIDDVGNDLMPKLVTSENSKPSIFERLSAIANQDTTKLKSFQKPKSNSSSRYTKAIEVLDLNKLQDTDQISIRTIPMDSPECDTLKTTASKKDSFFLNGDQEVESSEDESNVNGFKNLKSNDTHFSARAREINSFGNRSFNNFREKHFNKNKLFSKNQHGKDFYQNESRFQENLKRNSLFNNRIQLDTKSKGQHHSYPSRIKDSLHLKRENRKNNSSFQLKKHSNEKDEKSADLHPSWKAKNKLKEAAKSGFKGKRIVFD